MLHVDHGGRNDVKRWVWYGVWLPVPELYVKKLATMVSADVCTGLVLGARTDV